MSGRINVLDHGYVRLIETWGGGHYGAYRDNENESGIIEAARQSTQGSFRGWYEDHKLLRYLKENKHDTPFEFAGMVIEVRAPIFVFREWHRHRTQSYNEMSARYTPLPDLGYAPALERITMNMDKGNKQAGTVRGSAELTQDKAEQWQDHIQQHYADFAETYRRALDSGIPKELARVSMPVGWYSQMRASANLRNWLSFLTLRLDPHAQWEIRKYAEAVGRFIEEQFPHTWQLFLELQENKE